MDKLNDNKLDNVSGGVQSAKDDASGFYMSERIWSNANNVDLPAGKIEDLLKLNNQELPGGQMVQPDNARQTGLGVGSPC